jgi:hypothetical protein
MRIAVSNSRFEDCIVLQPTTVSKTTSPQIKRRISALQI